MEERLTSEFFTSPVCTTLFSKPLSMCSIWSLNGQKTLYFQLLTELEVMWFLCVLFWFCPSLQLSLIAEFCFQVSLILSLSVPLRAYISGLYSFRGPGPWFLLAFLLLYIMLTSPTSPKICVFEVSGHTFCKCSLEGNIVAV